MLFTFITMYGDPGRKHEGAGSNCTEDDIVVNSES